MFIIVNWKRAFGQYVPATLIFRSSHSFITLSSSVLYLFLAHYIISPTFITHSINSEMFFAFKLYLLQKRWSLNGLNMILETPNFKVTNFIFESYQHRSESDQSNITGIDST